MPIIVAAVLSHEGLARWWLALPVCLLGCCPGTWCSFFTNEFTAVMADVERVERWLALDSLLVVAAMLAVTVWRWQRRVVGEPRDR